MNYRKLRKLIATPRQFFIDALNNKIYGSSRPKVQTQIGKKKPGNNATLSTEFYNHEKLTLSSTKKNYLYVPWIAEHTDTLFKSLDDKSDVNIIALSIFPDIKNPETRRNINNFARTQPQKFRNFLLHHLTPFASKIEAFLFSFDWSPAMKLIAQVCEELNIPRILIPHESIFIDREKYYVDMLGLSSIPVADITLGWGGVQKDVFIERGYPTDRYITVGSPKLDKCLNYSPTLSKDSFFRIFGLDPDKKTILFAAQPLDSQTNSTGDARAVQVKIINELIEYVIENQVQLIIRTPPSNDSILDNHIIERAETSASIRIDSAECYICPAEETVHHCDVITSINSTMLLEGLIFGKTSISTNYFNFDSQFKKLGVYIVHQQKELYSQLDDALKGESESNTSKRLDNIAKISQFYCGGYLDGNSATRISNYISSFHKASWLKENTINSAKNRIFKNQTLDVVGIPSNNNVITTGTQKYLSKLINCRTLISTWENKCAYDQIATVELFLQWGITESTSKKRQHTHATHLSRPVIIIEDGFIRSVDIGLSGTPGLSIILDDTTAYYDATKASRLNKLLESDIELTVEQKNRARLAINKIVENKVSKYNHAKCLPIKIGKPDRKKILLLDQRFGDQSVTSGLADEVTFEKMLNDAIVNNPDCDIIIKQHPDAIKGGKSSYYSDERLAFTKYVDNVYTVNFDINPYSLLDLVEEVYVVTSGMGFEALMAGKKVHCYGMPFYAGWGATVDQKSVTFRTKMRSVEELFYFAYIEASRYFNPDLNRQVEVEEVVDYIIKHRR